MSWTIRSEDFSKIAEKSHYQTLSVFLRSQHLSEKSVFDSIECSIDANVHSREEQLQKPFIY